MISLADLQRLIAQGDLSADADPVTLARYIATFAYGIAVQAATGTPRDALLQIADSALLAWPRPEPTQ